MNTLRGKNFLSIMDLSKAELEWLISRLRDTAIVGNHNDGLFVFFRRLF